MFKWFDWVWRIVVAVIGIMIIWKFWMWWRPEPPTTYLRTDLINAQQSDNFYSGFATVALVRFDTGGSELEKFSVVTEPSGPSRIEGFCYRLYDVSIGYPSLQAALDTSESSIASSETESEAVASIPEPKVLSGNVIEARHGGSATQLMCDSINHVTPDRPNEDRLEMLRETLVDNGQWESHVKHARNVITAFSRSLVEQRKAVVENRIESVEKSRASLEQVSDAAGFQRWRTETLANLAEQPQGQQSQSARAMGPSTGIDDLDAILNSPQPLSPEGTRERGVNPLTALKERIDGVFADELENTQLRLSDAGGYLGALKLTFSTIGIFSKEDGRWFWKSDDFYIRQDLADATYGSDFTLDVSRSPVRLFGLKRLEITIPEPRLLALDRYTKVLVTDDDKFAWPEDGTALGTSIERRLAGDLKEQVQRVEPHAIRFAEAAMTAQIHALVETDVGEVQVRFVRAGRDNPSQLMDLIRLTRPDDALGDED
jgi:hypothetical protein